MLRLRDEVLKLNETMGLVHVPTLRHWKLGDEEETRGEPHCSECTRRVHRPKRLLEELGLLRPDSGGSVRSRAISSGQVLEPGDNSDCHGAVSQSWSLKSSGPHCYCTSLTATRSMIKAGADGAAVAAAVAESKALRHR
eukprot:GHVU01234218.1.p1 GENE.GHVU01234218.1~~GHVU01234218.1.p1  ORF type:complete len:139 (+),score=10.38 GHVU01234218.1:121-537(+)